MRPTGVIETKRAWDPGTGAFGEHRSGQRTSPFIKGPLPLAWINHAGKLPGKALHVGVVLWYLAGLNKAMTVRLGSKALAGLGVSRDAKYDALRRLKDAGLVSVDQKPGQVPVVTLLVVEP